jgi:hypothetical protein
VTVSDVCVCRRGRWWEKNRGWPIGHRLGEGETAPRREHVVGNFCFHDGRREMRFTTVVIRLSVSRPSLGYAQTWSCGPNTEITFGNAHSVTVVYGWCTLLSKVGGWQGSGQIGDGRHRTHAYASRTLLV